MSNKEEKEIKEIIREEKEILKEVKEEEKKIKKLSGNVLVLNAIIILIIVGAMAGGAYVFISSKNIYTDNASISAPTVDLAPQNKDILEEVFVKRGDEVNADTVVARVGNELIKTKTAGVVASVEDNIGKIINPGEAVVSIINPDDLRLVAHIDEDKGLSDIKIGQRAIFTVDAFSGKQYQGVVDEISPTARAGDVVFSISDKRQINVFDVKVRFNVTEYPELQNGMSAKVTIYKN